MDGAVGTTSVEALQRPLDPPRKLGAPVFGLERVQRGVACGLLDDAAHHRMYGVRRLVPQAFHRGKTFGHPRARIQQGRQFAERREIDRLHGRAVLAQGTHRLVEGGRRLRVAEELQLRGDGQPRRIGPGAPAVGRPRARIGIALVVAARDAGHELGVVHRQCEHRHAIQRAARRHHARRAEPAPGGLQADDIVEAGRHAARARGVRAQGKRRQPARHHGRGAGTGTAADVLRLEGVGHGAQRRTRAHQAGGELVQVGLAHQDGAGRAQAAHDGGVLIGHIGEFGAGGRGGPARGVDVVLDGEGHAIQRQARQIAVHGGEQAAQRLQLPRQRHAVHAADPGVVRRIAAFGPSGQ
jgi:hypothetical protein